MESSSTVLLCAPRREGVKHRLTRCFMVRARTASPGEHHEEASSTCSSPCVLSGCHRASPLRGFDDTPSSSRVCEGARWREAATCPGRARHDDQVSSSTARAVRADKTSSRMGWRRRGRLGVVKRHRGTCVTPQCGRAHCVVVSYALGFSPALLAPNHGFTCHFALIMR